MCDPWPWRFAASPTSEWFRTRSIQLPSRCDFGTWFWNRTKDLRPWLMHVVALRLLLGPLAISILRGWGSGSIGELFANQTQRKNHVVHTSGGNVFS